jgi:hypothetical protein
MFRILVLILANSVAVFALTLVGTIRDPSGAVIPGVTVDLIAEATGRPLTVRADSGGQFRATGLTAGQYQIKISHSGFQLYTQTVAVEENQTTAVEIRLEIAQNVQELRVSGKAGASANSDPNYRKLRDQELAETYLIENVVLKRDAGIITLKSGTIRFGPAILGKVTLGVFAGEGEFTLKPPHWMEATHMKRVLNKESIQENFRQLVLCFTDDTYEEIRRSARATSAESRTLQVLQEFRRHVRQRPEEPRSMIESLLGEMANVDVDTLADLYNPKQAGFFTAYITGRQHSHLRFYMKPRGAMPALQSPEEVAVINLDPQNEQEGIWYLCHSAGEMANHSASSHEDKRVISARDYRIETVIGRNDHLTGTADFRFRAVSSGDRVIHFDLLPSLRVTRVSIDTKQEIPYIQEDRKSDGSFSVIMPEPMVATRDYRLVIEYSGDRVIHKAGGGNFSVGARTSWYPSVNAFGDRATYNLTFKVPRSYTLVSTGKLAREWRENDFACSQWVSDVPLAVAGFNYGSFTKKQISDEPTKYSIEGYAASEMPHYMKGSGLEHVSPSALIDQSLGQTQNALRIFEHWFGKAPYGHIAITQQPEFNFGQSWPGLVYLPMSAYLDDTQRWLLMDHISSGLNAFIQEVTAHEVSHQWWGHVVGWATFHDQWLSEGFATFSAGLYLQATESKPDKYWKYLDRARELILEKNNYGKRANDAGPIWMGLRLNTFKNEGAYNRLVYSKGGYILHMLRSMMFDAKTGDQAFIKMMHEFVQSHFNQNASTESFKQVVDKYMTPEMDVEGNKQMDWFFAQWVYGTDIPRYKFDYTLAEESGGNWVVKCNLTQAEVNKAFVAFVPVYADLDGKVVLIGRVRMIGSSSLSGLKLNVPKKPKRVLINANYDVLAAK